MDQKDNLKEGMKILQTGLFAISLGIAFLADIFSAKMCFTHLLNENNGVSHFPATTVKQI